MAAAARTALLRFVATKIARRPGPGPAILSRRFSSSPTSASTPPESNNSKDATQNKIDLSELERAMATFIKVANGLAKSLAFGSVVYMFIVVKPAVEEIREGIDALERTISKLEDPMVHNHQERHDSLQGNCCPMEKQVEARDGLPKFLALQSTQSSASSSK